MGCKFELEEWGCASEIKQNLNKIKATPCKPAEGLLVYSTLPKVRAARAVVARQAEMEFSDDSDLSDRSKTR